MGQRDQGRGAVGDGDGREPLERRAVEQADQPRLAKMMENAAAWSLDVAPRGAIATAVGQVLNGLARDQTYTVYDPYQKAIGKLRVRKLADRGTAEAGDVVTITIIFENVGERPLHNVRIVDNLSPRLAFVAESGTIGFVDQDKKALEGDKWSGQIHVQDNDEGSEVLVFEIDAELPGGVIGEITFQARVR